MRNNNHAHLTNGIPLYGLHIVVLVHYAGCRPLPQNTRTLEHPYTKAHSTRKNISTSMPKKPVHHDIPTFRFPPNMRIFRKITYYIPKFKCTEVFSDIPKPQLQK